MRWKILLALLLLCGIVGCCTPGSDGSETGAGCTIIHVFDWFFAPSPTGTAPFQLLGMGLNVLIPGAGALLGMAGTAYSQVRASKWKTAFKTTAQVIETGASQGMSVADIKPHLADAHAMAGVDSLVGKVLPSIMPDISTVSQEQVEGVA